MVSRFQILQTLGKNNQCQLFCEFHCKHAKDNNNKKKSMLARKSMFFMHSTPPPQKKKKIQKKS